MRTCGNFHVFLLVKVILAVPVRTSEKQEVHRRPNDVHVAAFRKAAAKVPTRQSPSQSVVSVLELEPVGVEKATIASHQRLQADVEKATVASHHRSTISTLASRQKLVLAPNGNHSNSAKALASNMVASGQSQPRSKNSFLDVKHVGVANATAASHQVPINSTLVSWQKSASESIGNRSNDAKTLASDLVSPRLPLSPQGNNKTLPSLPSSAVVQPHGLAQQQSEHNQKDTGALSTPAPEGRLGTLTHTPLDLEHLIFNRTSFTTIFLWATLTALVGLFYHQEKAHPPRLDPEGVNVSLHDRDRLNRRRWRFGLLECCGAPSICCFSFFCAPIRWADTMRMAGFLNFFSALGLVIAMTVIGFLTFGFGFFVLLFVMVLYRQRLQDKFNIRRNTGKDWLSFVFCPWCSIAQEARQVEEAYLARHPAVRAQQPPKRFAFGKDCSVIKA